jgi:aspartyl-tRNA(Asn)/glutamyl-tRNA(Gln) amidotransferase subunit A
MLLPAPDRPVSRRDFLRTTGATLAVLGLAGGSPALARAEENPADMTLRQASAALRRGTVSSADLTRACLARIDQSQARLNAFITVTRDLALAQASSLDAEARSGKWRGPLHGIPIALKDNIDTAGIRTTAASALFADRIPAEDGEVVRRLKAAGAVLVGKLNMDEFAAGGTSTTTYFDPVHNPWALDRSAGGSSGGSGAAVAAALCFGTLGTDTTGSLRIPAAFCSVVGLKPTYGRVSSRGVIPLSWTQDHVGPLGRTVEDAALLLQAIAGYDPLDMASVDVPVPDYLAGLRTTTTGLRLGVPRAHFYDKLDGDVAEAVRRALEVLRPLAQSLRDVDLPPLITTAQVVEEEMYTYHATWFAQAPHLYQLPTRRSLAQGAKLTAVDYVQARRDIDRLRREIRTVFANVDLLVTPTVKIQPRTIAESIQRSMSDRPFPPAPGNTGLFNILGLPAISVPCGFTSAGLPVGLQIIGPHFAEARVLAMAHAYEQATEWHKRRPSLPTEGDKK